MSIREQSSMISDAMTSYRLHAGVRRLLEFAGVRVQRLVENVEDLVARLRDVVTRRQRRCKHNAM